VSRRRIELLHRGLERARQRRQRSTQSVAGRVGSRRQRVAQQRREALRAKLRRLVTSVTVEHAIQRHFRRLVAKLALEHQRVFLSRSTAQHFGKAVRHAQRRRIRSTSLLRQRADGRKVDKHLERGRLVDGALRQRVWHRLETRC
jgi:hypothetical protein